MQTANTQMKIDYRESAVATTKSQFITKKQTNNETSFDVETNRKG